MSIAGIVTGTLIGAVAGFVSYDRPDIAPGDGALIMYRTVVGRIMGAPIGLLASSVLVIWRCRAKERV